MYTRLKLIQIIFSCIYFTKAALFLPSKRHSFNPWVGKISWRRKRHPTPVFLPREFHGRRSLVGYSPQGRKKSRTRPSYFTFTFTFLPKSKRLFISWLQSPSVVILEPRKIKLATVSTVSPSICHEVMGPDAMILGF